MKGWKEYKIGDLVKFGNGKERPKAVGSIPVYGGNGIMGNCQEFNYEHETIIIGRVGAYCGSVYYKNGLVWVSDNALAAKPKNGYNAIFLYYLLKNLNLNNKAQGSSHPLVTQGLLNSLDVYTTTDVAEQTAIASILSSLDDKIDLLHRQNKTLEEMAATLFRQWFVEEAEEDWENGKLYDVLDLKYGKALKENLRTGIGYPVVGSSGIVGYHSEYMIKGPGIVIGRKGTLGKVIYLFENFHPIDTTYFIESKVDSANLLYEYFLLRSLDLGEMNSDSAVPGLNRDIALATEIKLPPFKIRQQFEEECDVLFQKIKSNTRQIETLTKLRDALLPKLMSGEVLLR